MKQKETLMNLLDAAKDILSSCELLLETYSSDDIRWTLRHQIDAIGTMLWTTRRTIGQVITEEE